MALCPPLPRCHQPNPPRHRCCVALTQRACASGPHHARGWNAVGILIAYYLVPLRDLYEAIALSHPQLIYPPLALGETRLGA
jgi:hypothetical protein